MAIEIPIYRGKEIKGDSWPEGYLIEDSVLGCMIIPITSPVGLYVKQNLSYEARFEEAILVDRLTLAIHFSAMLDENNKPFFASLDDKKGIGGDKYTDGYHICVWVYSSILGSISDIHLENFNQVCTAGYLSKERTEVIGIYKGEETNG